MAAPNENSTATPTGADATRPSEALSSEFPPEIALKDLRVTHKDYRSDLIDKYEDLYCGGERFRDHIENYLDSRGQDKKGLRPPNLALDIENPRAVEYGREQFHLEAMASQRWEERKRVSRYTNYPAGMLDYFVSAIFYSEPAIIGEGYWTAFSKDVDGSGCDISAKLRHATLEQLKHNRTFLVAQAGEATGARNKAEQRALGGLNATMHVLCASDVDLWEYAGQKLKWIRTHRKDVIRSKPYGKPDKIRELWTYITSTSFIEYEIEYHPDKPPSDEETRVIRKGEPKPHGFPRIPVVEIRLPKGLWAMARLEEPALKLFNREAALSWALNTGCFQILGISTEKPISMVVDVGNGALDLGIGGSARFIGPEANVFDANSKDVENCKKGLYEVFQSMGLNALANQTQNARQSAEAKTLDREPLSALLRMFASAIRDALENIAALIAEFREEQIPQIHGLDRFDVLSLADKFANLKSAEEINGFSIAARQWMLQDAGLSVAANAPGEVKAQIVEQSVSANIQPAVVVEESAIVGDTPATATTAAARKPQGEVQKGAV